MKRILSTFTLSFFCLLSLLAGRSHATTILPGGSFATGPLVDLGWFTPGIWDFYGSGQMDLVSSAGTFLLDADGVPITGVTEPGYLYFNPSGSDEAPVGHYGAAGPGVNLGAIIGTFDPTPSVWSDWFLIGSYAAVTVSGGGSHIYVSFNDVYHQNNVGRFEVTFSPRDPVPEPATLLLFGAGILGVAGLRRRKN